MLQHLVIAIPAVFFVVDPPGAVPAFIAMTRTDTPEKTRAMALKACIFGASLLTFFAFFGAFVFKWFGVTLGAFRVAGGILLLLTALDMLRARQSSTRVSEEEEAEGVAKEDIAIVPLGIPLLAGPGSIATVMVLMADGDTWLRGVAVCVAIGLTFAAGYFLLRGAVRVKKVLGQTGLAVTQRVFGLLLAALAVQFMADGAIDLWRAH